MSDLNMSLVITQAIADQIISKYFSQARSELLEGKNVLIPGVGTIVPKIRRVKNDLGRDYSIKLKVVLDKDFSKELVRSYEEDPSKFKG